MSDDPRYAKVRAILDELGDYEVILSLLYIHKSTISLRHPPYERCVGVNTRRTRVPSNSRRDKSSLGSPLCEQVNKNTVCVRLYALVLRPSFPPPRSLP